MKRFSALRALGFLGVLALSATAVDAQSLFGTRGLGVPVDPVDPRSRALGNVGLGLIGLNTSLVNPAELAGIRRRGVVATLQPFYASESVAGGDDDISGTRFPLIHLMYPPRQRLVFGLGYGGFLDQSWAVFATSRQRLGRTDSVTVRDRVAATGAIAQIRLSAAYELSSTINLGGAIGLYTGSLEREVVRAFPDTLVPLRSFTTRSNWDYRAPLVALGVRYDPSASARIAWTVTWSGTLSADARADDLPDAEYALPLRVSFGASTLLTPRLLATASGHWSGWDESADYSAAGAGGTARVVARPTVEVGGGLEWERLRSGARVFPIRVGARYAQLPFHQEGDAPAHEIAGSVGLGLRLAGDDFGPLAVGDIGLERGRRTGWDGSLPGGLREDFWRISVSIALFGR